jgi:hypothetical protein
MAMDEARIKSLKFVEKQIDSDPRARRAYRVLRDNGLKETVLFAELVGWVVITVVDKKRLIKRKSLKTEKYFPIRLESMAKDIEAFNLNPLFVPDHTEHNELPARLRSYAEQFHGRLMKLKRNGKGWRQPTVHALTSLRWLVETQTNRKTSPAGLEEILNAVLWSDDLDRMLGSNANRTSYNFAANLKKIPPISSVSGNSKVTTLHR